MTSFPPQLLTSSAVLRKKITLPQPQGGGSCRGARLDMGVGHGRSRLAWTSLALARASRVNSRSSPSGPSVGPASGSSSTSWLTIVVVVVKTVFWGPVIWRVQREATRTSERTKRPQLNYCVKASLNVSHNHSWWISKTFIFFHFKGRNVVAFDHKFDPTHWQFGGPREYWPNARRASIGKVSARRSSPEYASWPMHV
jgi:hypothetical protein